ncbi:MAG: DUF305 domain-containing protein [Daejeonella sp.]|uniref:DUF305 domain-containing protein n=1 Tax=Daejeonella sp. TaxID=2805397 RepID=UPI003C796EE0
MYKKFLIMLLASFVIMYGVMFLNVDRFEHIYLSTSRFYMTLLMVSPMALLMLALMPTMYNNKKLNTIITITSIAVFILSLSFLRTQTLIADEQYMKAMIPHHSSAILVSQEAQLKNPKVKKLAEEIIKAQEKEISEMKQLLKELETE